MSNAGVSRRGLFVTDATAAVAAPGIAPAAAQPAVPPAVARASTGAAQAETWLFFTPEEASLVSATVDR